MKILHNYKLQRLILLACCILSVFVFSGRVLADEKPDAYIEYRGVVLDKSTGNVLAFANISLLGTNISTVSNTNGEFVLKVPTSRKVHRILFRYVGYRNLVFAPGENSLAYYRIELEPVSV